MQTELRIRMDSWQTRNETQNMNHRQLATSSEFYLVCSVHRKPMPHALYGTGSNLHCTELYISITTRSRRKANEVKNQNGLSKNFKRDEKYESPSTIHWFWLLFGLFPFWNLTAVQCLRVLKRTRADEWRHNDVAIRDATCENKRPDWRRLTLLTELSVIKLTIRCQFNFCFTPFKCSTTSQTIIVHLAT